MSTLGLLRYENVLSFSVSVWSQSALRTTRRTEKEHLVILAAILPIDTRGCHLVKLLRG